MNHTTDNRTPDSLSSDEQVSSLPVVPAQEVPTGSESAAADQAAIDRINDTLEVASEGLHELTDGQDPQPRSTESQAARPPAVALSLSIVVSVFNQQETIEDELQGLVDMEAADEIIVVDDGSTDGTHEKLQELAQRMPLRIERHERHRGKGAALRTAIAAAESELIVIHDIGAEYNPAEIAVLRKPIEAGCCDVIFGSRYLAPVDADPSPWHASGNRLLTRVSNFFTGQNLTDMETCYKVFRRQLLTGVELREEGLGIEPELTAKLARQGGRIYELPITFRRDLSRDRQTTMKDALRSMWCILRYAKRD